MARRLIAEIAMVVGALIIAPVIASWEPEWFRPIGPRYMSDSQELRQEIRLAQDMHREAVRADSLARMMPDDSVFAVYVDGITVADSSFGDRHGTVKVPPERVRQIVTAELGGITPAVPVGIFVVPSWFGMHSPSSLVTRDGQALPEAVGFGVRAEEYEVFTQRSDTAAYCFAVATPRALHAVLARDEFRAVYQMRHRPSTSHSALGPCIWWAKYGAPGAGVDELMRSGGYTWADAEADWLEKDAFRRRNRWGEPWLMAPSRRGMLGLACLAGREGSCVATITDSAAVEPAVEPGIAAYERGYSYLLGFAEGAMFAHVEREFGRDRFARFWQSDADAETAFASAFGIGLDEWIMRWARDNYGTDTPGPRMSLSGALYALLMAAALFGISVSVMQRRSIG